MELTAAAGDRLSAYLGSLTSLAGDRRTATLLGEAARGIIAGERLCCARIAAFPPCAGRKRAR